MTSSPGKKFEQRPNARYLIAYEITIVCLLHPLTISTLSHRFIPGGTLGGDFGLALDESVDVGVLLAVPLVLVLRTSVVDGPWRRCCCLSMSVLAWWSVLDR